MASPSVTAPVRDGSCFAMENGKTVLRIAFCATALSRVRFSCYAPAVSSLTPREAAKL